MILTEQGPVQVVCLHTCWGGNSSKVFVVSTSFSANVLLLVHSTASSCPAPLMTTLHTHVDHMLSAAAVVTCRQGTQDWR